MTTEKEFLEIMKNNLVLQANGSIKLEIQDQKLADEYKEFITKHAKKQPTKLNIADDINFICHIILPL